MKNALMSVLCFGLLAAAGIAKAEKPANVTLYLQENCVMVDHEDGYGSGAVIVREVEGRKVAFVLTAYHVIAGVNPDEIRVIQPADKERILSELVMKCSVFATSPSEDIAVLRLNLVDFFHKGVDFSLDDVSVGTELYLCSSPLGKHMINSVTQGIVASINRVLHDNDFYQTTCATLPGSSGGAAVRASDGLYVGMLTTGFNGTESFNLIVPAKRIAAWADKNKLRFLVDRKVPVPKESELEKLKVNEPPSVLVNPAERDPAADDQIFLIP